MPFDKLKARVQPRGSGSILIGAFYPDLKIGVWRRRTYQYLQVTKGLSWIDFAGVNKVAGGKVVRSYFS